MSSIEITSLLLSGTLELGSAPIGVGQEITLGLLGTLKYVPDPFFLGSDTFTWNAFDGLNYAAVDATTTLNLAFVNQPPTVTLGSNVNVLINSGAYTATAWATNISPGPANEISQTLAFTVTTNNPGLFAVQPTLALSGTTGDLTFTPTFSVTGSANITVTLQDNGGIANGGHDTLTQMFKITVKPYQVFLPSIQR